MIAATFLPISVFSATAARKISPVEIWGTLYFSAIILAWVPLPDPGAPNKAILIVTSPKK